MIYHDETIYRLENRGPEGPCNLIKNLLEFIHKCQINHKPKSGNPFSLMSPATPCHLLWVNTFSNFWNCAAIFKSNWLRKDLCDFSYIIKVSSWDSSLWKLSPSLAQQRFSLLMHIRLHASFEPNRLNRLTLKVLRYFAIFRTLFLKRPVI